MALIALATLAGCPHLLASDGAGADGGADTRNGAGGDFGAPGDLAIRSDGMQPIADLAHAPSDLSQATPADLSRPAPADLSMASGGALDPGLSLPDPSGPACTTPGSLGECPFLDVCRFYTATQGRCESCTSCNNLGAACSASSDCDILFMCWQGKCTNFCTLGTTECGPPANCLNIGHPTKGVCK
ncbi:MAG TPA: hypothetical protein VFF06_08290 [Polyangia bacterium]|nr:hypothetical protein [Polyangia bacterium]